MKKDLRASRSKQIATSIVAVLTAILAACSNAASPSLTAPDHSVDPGVEQAVANARALSSTIPGSFVAQGLLRDRSLPEAITVTKVISSEGGTVDIPAADFQLQIPRGAVDAPLSISVTALRGTVIAYDFQPHDATFAAPLKFVQRLNHTSLRGAARPSDAESDVGLANFSDPSMIDPVTGIGVASDSVPSQIRPRLNGNLLSFMIWRFSGYMASTGRH